MEPGKVSVQELFSEFGSDETEDRKLDARLWQVIHMTRAGNWIDAVGIFQEYLEKYPDYDVPHIWLAEFANQSEGPAKAVEMIRSSAAVERADFLSKLQSCRFCNAMI